MNIHRIIYLISNNFAIQGKNLNFHSNAMKHFFYEEQGNINENSETLKSGNVTCNGPAVGQLVINCETARLEFAMRQQTNVTESTILCVVF